MNSGIDRLWQGWLWHELAIEWIIFGMFLLAPVVSEVNGCLKGINEHSCGSSAAKVQISVCHTRLRVNNFAGHLTMLLPSFPGEHQCLTSICWLMCKLSW